MPLFLYFSDSLSSTDVCKVHVSQFFRLGINIDADHFVPSTQFFLRMCSAVHFCFHRDDRTAMYPRQSQCLWCLTQAVQYCDGPFSPPAMRPNTSATYGAQSLSGGRWRVFFHFFFFFLSFPNSLPEMTVLKNAYVKIEKEKKTGNNHHKTSSHLITQHFLCEWIGSDAIWGKEERGKKGQYILDSLQPSQELEIRKIVYNYLCWVKLNCLYLQ